jgi:hypothetical protein
VCSDAIDVLVRSNVELLPLRSNITTEEALRTIWDRVPYRPGTETLTFDGDDGTFIHDYVFDRAYDEKTTVIAEIKKLVVISRGFFFQRHYDGVGMTYVSLDAYKKASVWFNSTAPILKSTQFQIREMEAEHQTSNIYNSVTVRYYPRKVDSAATTVLFTTQERVFIKAGATATIEAAYRDLRIGRVRRLRGQNHCRECRASTRIFLYDPSRQRNLYPRTDRSDGGGSRLHHEV